MGVFNPLEGKSVAIDADALKDANDRYQSIFSYSPVGLAIADLKGVIVDVSQVFSNLTGFLPKDVIGKNIEDITYLEDKAEHLHLMDLLLSGKVPAFELEKRYIRKDGSIKWVKCRTTISRDETGRPVSLIAAIEDITESTTAVRTMKEKDAHFRGIIHQAPVAIGILQGDRFVIESANIPLLELWGKTDLVIGKTLLEALPEIEDQPFLELLRKVYTSGESYYGLEEKAILSRNGRMEDCYFNFVYSAIRESEGRITGVIVVASEVTEQVKTRKELEASEKRFRELLETTDVATALYSGKDFIIQFANEAMLRLWGKDASVIGKCLEDALPELEGQPFLGLLRDVYTSGNTYKATEDRADLVVDGRLQTFYFNFSYKPLKNSEGETYAILNMAVDVTEQVRAKSSLLDAEHRSRMAIEASEQGTYELDMQTGEITCSPRLLEIFGIPPGGIVTHDDLINRIHPEDLGIRYYAHADALKAGILSYEARILLDNNTSRWAKFTGKVNFDSQRRPLRLYGIVMDITRQKQEEIRKNDFIAMASHELKTPLTSVKGYLQVLSMESKKSDNILLQNIVTRAENQANKMAKLVNDFLDLSRIETGKLALHLETFSINDLIKETIEDISLISGTTTVEFKRGPDVKVNADNEKIGQVLSNFLNNALKYSPAGSPVVVESHASAEHVVVSVKDWGPGISCRDQQKVFDRYFRVENADNMLLSGFGIGLYISSEIIERHNGTIGVESEEGEGSRFYFKLAIA